MKHRSFLVAFILAATLLGAQTEDWFWNKPIETIQWEGIRNASRKELEALVKPFLGKVFDDENWTSLQSAVYALDWFETIEPVALPADPARSRVTIKFSVVEKPSLEAIRFSGASGLRQSELMAAITLKEGKIFGEDKAKADADALRKIYIEKGYPSADITWSTNPGSGKNLLILTFKIKEGTKVSVKEIRFKGNSTVSSRTLKAQMELKEAGLFQSGVFQESQLEAGKEALLDFYMNRGFIDIKIKDIERTYEKDSASGREWLVLTVSISEGRAWTFSGMKFAGNKVFPSSKLTSLVLQKPGQPLSMRKLLQDKQRIDDLYYESGYIFNSIDLSETRDESTGNISFTVNIIERDRAHIESISFRGNTKTREHILRRELPLEVGDIFSKAKIVEGLRNLYNLQYFSAVQPDLQQGSAEDLMDLTVAVEEQSTANINFGLTLSGFGDPDTFPISGQVKWNDRNFLGLGRTLKIEATGSPDTQSLVFGYGENWLFGKRISYSLDLSFSHATKTTGQDILDPVFSTEDIPDPFIGIGSGTDLWDGSLSTIPDEYRMPYEDWNASLGASTGYTFKTDLGDAGLGGSLSFGINRWDYDAEKYRPYLSSMRKYAGEWLINNRLSFKASLNALDLWYNPSSGYFASQRLSWNGFFPFEYQHFIKSETRLDAYLTLFSIPVGETWKWKWVLAGHTGFQALLAQPGKSSPDIVNDYISLDGTFNARGWRNLYGQNGIALWENSLELRMPIVDQVLWLDGFIDAAALLTTTGLVDMTGTAPEPDITKKSLADLGFGNIAFSSGFGFRFPIAQFPFRFYFLKRFSFDGNNFSWKGTGSGLEFVLSITQPL